ncbi:MAG: hypothetical protein E6K91_04515 [Thaumarchaeota archaeon]|nr:MAG: hypothetical protein E6K91_04515 [Nitrososphaerota archaeon]
MLKNTIKDDPAGKIVSIIASLGFEMLGSGEEKRNFLKLLKKANENGEKFDPSWFKEFKRPSLANIPS